jgi:AcrR family transcriptional regulator
MRLDRKKIIDAALSLTNSHPDSQLAMASLARSLGVLPPNLYKHFSSSEDLMDELTVLSFKRLKETILECSLGRHGDDALRHIAMGVRKLARKHQGEFRLLMSASGKTVEQKQIRAELSGILARIFDPTDSNSEDTIHRIRIFRSLIFGFISLELNNAFNAQISTDSSFEKILVSLSKLTN